MVHGHSASLKFAELRQVPWISVMDPWQRIASLTQQLAYMNENIVGYREALKVEKAEKEVDGYNPRFSFLSPFFFFFDFFAS